MAALRLTFDAVFFLLPFVAYGLWLMATRRSASAGSPDWQVRTIAYLAHRRRRADDRVDR